MICIIVFHTRSSTLLWKTYQCSWKCSSSEVMKFVGEGRELSIFVAFFSCKKRANHAWSRDSQNSNHEITWLRNLSVIAITILDTSILSVLILRAAIPQKRLSANHKRRIQYATTHLTNKVTNRLFVGHRRGVVLGDLKWILERCPAFVFSSCPKWYFAQCILAYESDDDINILVLPVPCLYCMKIK